MLYGRDKLIKLMQNGSICSEKTVTEYIRDGLISECNCDLLLGDACYVSNTRTRKSNNKGLYYLPLCKSVVIPPMGIMLFQTEATFSIPKECAFRISLRMHYLKKGLIMSNQPLGQPGYSGNLFGIVLNVSNKPIRIHHRERMLTLEALEINGNSGAVKQIQGENMREFAENAITTSFRQEVLRMQKLSKKLNHSVKGQTRFQMAMLSISSFIMAVLSIALTLSQLLNK